jgi:hypothetical protein
MKSNPLLLKKSDPFSKCENGKKVHAHELLEKSPEDARKQNVNRAFQSFLVYGHEIQLEIWRLRIELSLNGLG